MYESAIPSLLPLLLPPEVSPQQKLLLLLRQRASERSLFFCCCTRRRRKEWRVNRRWKKIQVILLSPEKKTFSPSFSFAVENEISVKQGGCLLGVGEGEEVEKLEEGKAAR